MATHLRTEFAMKALDLADLFKVWIGQTPVPGPVTYRVELSAPDGMSTGGGTQSVQHIKLIPVDGGPTVVAGSANQVEGAAELRTFEHLAELHAQRFKGAEIPLDRGAYNDLVKRMQTFFSDKGLRLVMVDAAPRATARPEATAPRPNITIVIVGLVAIAAAVAGGMLLLLGHR
jgi:hypothetical protein